MKWDKDDFIKIYPPTPPQMPMKSRAELYTILPPNPVVAAVGSAEGLFDRDILKYWKASKLYSVDNWGKIPGQTGDGGFENDWHEKNYQNALSLFKEFGDKSVILRGISWEMAKHVPDESLDCVYIDCCHEYGCVKNDLAAWVPKVKKLGIIAFHDYLVPQYGVKQAVNEYAQQHGYKVEIIPENGPDASAYFRVA